MIQFQWPNLLTLHSILKQTPFPHKILWKRSQIKFNFCSFINPIFTSHALLSRNFIRFPFTKEKKNPKMKNLLPFIFLHNFLSSLWREQKKHSAATHPFSLGKLLSPHIPKRLKTFIILFPFFFFEENWKKEYEGKKLKMIFNFFCSLKMFRLVCARVEYEGNVCSNKSYYRDYLQIIWWYWWNLQWRRFLRG